MDANTYIRVNVGGRFVWAGTKSEELMQYPCSRKSRRAEILYPQYFMTFVPAM